MKASHTWRRRLTALVLCGALAVPVPAALAAENSATVQDFQEAVGQENAAALNYIAQAMSDEELASILEDYLAVAKSEADAYARFAACLQGIYQEVQANGFTAEQAAQLFRNAAALETGNADMGEWTERDPEKENIPVPSHGDEDELTLYVNSDYVETDEAAGAPYINEADRTMIPLRVVNTAMGYATDWQPDGSIHITSADGTVDVTLTVGSADYTVNGEAGQFATVPTLKNDRTYLPAREFSELYGSIYWENTSRTVWIYQSEDTEYRVFGTTLLRADGNGIQPLTLPEGFAISEKAGVIDRHQPITDVRVYDGVTYMTVNVDGAFNDGTLPLFREDGDHLTYLTQVNGGAEYLVDGDTVYYAESVGAGAWDPAENPTYLYVTTLRADASDVETTAVYDLGFDVSQCRLSMKDGVLIATAIGTDEAQTIDLSALTPVQTWSSQQ